MGKPPLLFSSGQTNDDGGGVVGFVGRSPSSPAGVASERHAEKWYQHFHPPIPRRTGALGFGPLLVSHSRAPGLVSAAHVWFVRPNRGEKNGPQSFATLRQCRRAGLSALAFS